MTNSSYKIVEINSMFKVILNPVPTSKSATLGFWCQGGSCKENDENNGIAHVLEHMMFKGTKTLTSKEIGRKLEKLGAYSNAYTSEESVCYYLSVGPTNLVVDGKNNLLSSMEILFDMFLNSVFPPEELEKEKDVIVQELRMYEDDLTSRCFANLHKIAYNPHTYLHREIIGTEENIRGFTSPQLIKFMEDYYNNIHFIMVGNFDEEKVLEFCKSQGDNFLKKFTNKNIVQEPVVYKKKTFNSIRILRVGPIKLNV
jgi:predicted Zn-dependent peptidase